MQPIRSRCKVSIVMPHLLSLASDCQFQLLDKHLFSFGTPANSHQGATFGSCLLCLFQFFQKRGVSEAMSVYELFNAVSGLNIPISSENEEEFLTEVGSHTDVSRSDPELVFWLLTAFCVTDRGAGEEERGPRPEAEKENLSCGIGGQRPASRARR